jgi:hypothetical protein
MGIKRDLTRVFGWYMNSYLDSLVVLSILSSIICSDVNDRKAGFAIYDETYCNFGIDRVDR